LVSSPFKGFHLAACLDGWFFSAKARIKQEKSLLHRVGTPAPAGLRPEDVLFHANRRNGQEQRFWGKRSAMYSQACDAAGERQFLSPAFVLEPSPCSGKDSPGEEFA
jgi:hypothetical protein